MNFWSTLGMEPTADLIAIKRAYAARLKVTRPDDDAQAYQALREAYEFAQEHARWLAQHAATHAVEPLPEERATITAVALATAPEQHAATDEGHASIAAEEALAPEPQALPEPEPAHEPHLEPQPGPEAPPLSYVPARVLAEQTLAYLQQAGGEALIAGWPLLEQELGKLPFWEHSEASKWFAQLVIDAEQMPRGFAQGLSTYFGWETDFRTEQVMGASRAVALRQRLHDLNFGFHADENFRRRYAELSFFGPMIEQVAKWRLYLFAMLASSRLARLWGELEPRQRYVLGVPPPQHSRADHAMEVGAWVRTFAVLLVAATVVQLKGYAERPWLERLAFAVANGVVGWVVLHFAYRFFLSFKASVHATLRPEGLAPGLPKRSHLAAVGFACMLAATFMCGLSETDAWPAAFHSGFGSPVLVCITVLLIAFAVMTPSLPPTEASPAFPAILVLCIVVGIYLPWFSGLPWTGACAGMAWFMAACLAHTLHGDAIESRWRQYKEDARRHRERTNQTTHHGLLVMVGSLLRITVAWPYRLMQLGASQSPRLVIAIVCISIAALPAQERAWQLPFSAAVAGLFVLFASLWFNHAVLALLPGQKLARRGWIGLALLTLWAVWAGVYYGASSWIDTHLGWGPAANPFETQVRRFGLTFCAPLLLMMWTSGFFRLVKVQSRTGSR
ncbi:J domain-containing protein [Variovorax paradoxus]|uniref:J domain-containing protein n=1 Tax=Variovorax paradoxus TaxID=34073 RepID=UPI0024806124|nr:J domain-containing protein [Variovorax paradoxus]WGT66166.1 J domain-containing protein [Variovorax paradoxus]